MDQRPRTNILCTPALGLHSRRQFVQVLTLGLAATSLGTGLAHAEQPNPSAGAAKKKVLLVQPSQVGELTTRTKIVLEVAGQLRVTPEDSLSKSDDKASKKDSKTDAAGDLEVKGKSTLDYFEMVAFAEDAQSQLSAPTAAARQYIEAEVENWVAGKSTTSKLRPDCSETRLLPHNGLWQQYCETHPLDSREVQLLHSPINSAAIELLLPVEPARADSNWVVSSENAKRIFNLDAVHNSRLTAKISKVEKGVATVVLKGELDATANSVPTRLDVDGNFQVKLGSQCAMVTWLGVVIKEERQVSQAEPGFSVTARVRLIREESDKKLSMTADALRELATVEDEGRWLVQLHSTAGGYTMLTDRRWHIHRDSAEESILRMVENNTVIAQCTVSRLAELEAGQQLTMEGLQSDIRGLLGKGFGEFLESTEKVTANKLRMIRTVVGGELEEVPIQWIYTHLSDDQGRRLALIYTMGGTVTDRFGVADEQMAGSFRWIADASKSTTKSAEIPKSDAKSVDKKTAERPDSRTKR